MKQFCLGFATLCLLFAASAGEPARAQGVGLTPIAGNFQTVAPNSQFAIAAQLFAPAPAGVEIQLLNAVSAGPSIACAPGVTNANGVVQLTCQVGSWPIEIGVKLTVGNLALGATADFLITIRPPFLLEGLTKLQGDQAFALRGQTFDLTVQAVRANQPEQGVRFTITRSPSELPVSCPAAAITDSIGQARITCEVLDILPADATLLVTFRDINGRSATFTVFLLARDSLADGIFKVSGDDQAVPQGSTLAFPLVAAVVQNGRPASGAQIIVEVSDPQLLICPQRVGADPQGRVSIVCSAGPVRANGFAAVHLRDGFSLALLEPFRVSVVGTGTARGATMQLASPTSLRGRVGQTIEDAIRIQALDGAGRPAAGVAIFPTADLNVTFSPSVAVTGFNGEAVFDTTLGCPGGSGLIRLGPLPGTTSLAVSLDIATGGPALLNKIQGDNQFGSPGEKLTNKALVVTVTNLCLQGIQRETVAWSVNPPAAATLENVISTTDARGRSSVLVRMGSKPGPFTVTARHQGRTQIFNLTVASRPTGLSAISPQRITTPRNTTTEPLAVEVVSADGFGVPGVDVQFQILEGLGTLTESLVETGPDGRASTRFVAPAQYGTARVRATVAPATAAAVLGTPPSQQQGALVAEFVIVTGGRRPEILPPGGFVNGASFRSGWAPGGLGSIFGVGLMEDVNGVVAPNGPPFPTTLRGVSVTINGVRAPLLALANVAGREQINLQVPFETAPGNATVIVNNNGTEAVFENVQVVPAQPGIFEVDVQGGRYAAALHADFRLVAPSDPARPGETILLFVTGMGALQPAVATNQAGPSPAPRTTLDPVVGIDDQGVEDFGGYYAPNFLTLYQINLRLPNDIETGNHRVSVGAGGAFSQTAIIPVRR